MLNLQNQGYQCFLPWLRCEKLRRGAVTVVQEPLFPRYLFVRLDAGVSGQSWAPIRSTIGVTRLVTFGNAPARIDDQLVKALRGSSQAPIQQTQRLFEPGDRLQISAGAFAGLEAIYQMPDGDSRVMVLIELLSKPTRLSLSPAQLRKPD